MAAASLPLRSAEVRSMPAKVKTEAEISPIAPKPKAFDLGIKPAKTAALPAPDLTEVLAEDEKAGKNLDAKSPKRIGIKRPLEAVKPAGSDWKELADGSRVWVGRFFSAGSLGTRLHFQNVKLPAGTVLIAYDRANPQLVEGPFDDAYLAGRDSFWSSTVFGEDVMVEAHVPSGAALPEFDVAELTHQYTGLGTESSAKNAGACEIDFACHLAEWGQTGSAVGGIGSVSQNGVLFCTGCLLNDQNPAASTDYFLTARHCLTSQNAANSVEIYWLYQKATCNGVEPNPATVPRTRGGADILSFRARDVSTAGMNDHCFLHLRGTVPAGITYAGWTVETPAAGEVITCIHHPDGDYKRISRGTVSAQSSQNFWNIFWTPGQGVTEPGSSGSPIFNAAHQVIGQEFGGASACTQPNPALQSDDYGRFSITFPLVRAWLLNENPPPPPSGPTNNAFASALVLGTASGSVTGDSSNATRETGEPTITANPGGASVWYRWTAPGSGVATFDTVGSAFDTLVAVYTGAAVNALTLVMENDDINTQGGIYQSRVTFTATAGVTYRIAVDGYNGESGIFALNWSGPGGTGGNNNNFTNATVIIGATGQATSSNVGYTREAGEPTHQPAGFPAAEVGQRSAWWLWTAPASGSITFSTMGSSFDTVLAVYTGNSVGALTQVVQNDDANGTNLTSLVTFSAVQGSVYRIAVDGYRTPGGDQREGSITLNWSSGATPPPTGKPDLMVWEPSMEPRLEIRTFAAGDCSVVEGCAIAGRRKLITFNTEVRNLGTADVRLGVPGPGNTNFIWDPCHGHYHWTNYAAYRLVNSNGVVTVGRKIGFCLLDSIHWNSTNGPAESRYDCNDQGISVGWGDVYGRNLSCQWIDVTDVPDGNYTIEIEVDPSNQFDELNESNNVVRVPFTIMPIVIPANDEFASARPISGTAGVVNGNNIGASVQVGEPDGGGQTVWFRWQAPCSGNVVFDTASTRFDTILAAYTGASVNALTRVAFNDDDAAETTSRITFAATQNTVYYLAIGGFGNDDSGMYRLNWTLTGGSCPAPTRPIPIERPTANGPFTVGFFGQQGETYALDVTDSLVNPNWIRLLTTTGTGEMMQFTDNSAATHTFRYYKIVQIMP